MGNFFQPIPENEELQSTSSLRSSFLPKTWFASIQKSFESVLLERGVLFTLIGLCVSQSTMMQEMNPFAFAFFAAVYMSRWDRAPHVLIGFAIGVLLGNWVETSILLLTSTLFMVVGRHMLRGAHEVWIGVTAALLWFVMHGAMLGVQTLFGETTMEPYFILTMESALVGVLIPMFMTIIPILALNKRIKEMGTDEVISVILLFGAVLAGCVQWSTEMFSVEHTLARYMVVLFALAAGPALGSTAGVVTLMAISLSTETSVTGLGILAFTGLLAGMLRKLKRIGMALGMFVPTLFFCLYTPNGETIYISMEFLQTGIAFLLLILTPHSWLTTLSRKIPGTYEYDHEQREYVKKVRDTSVQKIAQFASVFRLLSNSFRQDYGTYEQIKAEMVQDRKKFARFLVERSCINCSQGKACRDPHAQSTSMIVEKIILEMERNGGSVKRSLLNELTNQCRKNETLLQLLYKEYPEYEAQRTLKQHIYESREMVAVQLKGMAKIIKSFSSELQKEEEQYHEQEDRILNLLHRKRIVAERVEIYQYKKGNMDIDIFIPLKIYNEEVHEAIGPILSGITEDPLVLERYEKMSIDSLVRMTFRSDKKFEVESGMVYVAKDGQFVCGDSSATFDIGQGKVALALSDGMGAGIPASKDSQTAIRLLEELLRAGIKEEVAIQSINSILALRSKEDSFSTLDLTIIDLVDAKANFMKMGCAPTFIIRGQQIQKINVSSIPMGILNEFEVDSMPMQLRAGDIVVMMSDGVYEGAPGIENYDVWMKRLLKERADLSPQEIAESLIEEVMKCNSQVAHDDMLVVAAAIQHRTPEWASVRSTA
ncbi:stage II sporulation protein E [Mangrovibacillus cuniculi]|uniref:Stage II sporulation protein E n=1 Tax=Mangrovibacillus cuniculi TaxID=2593652 RepID=A0A7S8CDI2_9BACI|nr:stage II sporulation protein E [Mangrovibacillus cuniculi]QPC47988.1 stage II sporulation protein E [Mangrovibacillus cuniculi]